MKRSAYDEDSDGSADLTFVNDGLSPGPQLEKRARSGSPPMIVGPLVFNSDGSALKQSLLAAQPSSLPGVHRLTASSTSKVRLWSPQWPAGQFLETALSQFLEAIDGKCVFIFDTRTKPSDPLLQGLVPVDSLLSVPTLQRWGVFVSKYEPSHGIGNSHQIPFIQDPVSSLAILCHFYEYLGPSAVCVKNGEVVATTMLTRAPEVMYNTLDEWKSI